LRQRENVLVLTVRDDGIGFEVTKILEEAYNRHTLGLLGMKERVQILGGRLELNSVPGKGTEIRVSFALPGDVTDAPEPAS
jgi:signal transduction histidine kinase